MSKTWHWQMRGTSERQHNTVQDSHYACVWGPSLDGMWWCSAASILHHQGNKNEEMPADTKLEIVESEDFEDQHAEEGGRQQTVN